MNGRHLPSLVVLGRLVGEKHWPHASFPSTTQHFFFFFYVAMTRPDLKKKMPSIKVSQLAVECTARPAGENKTKKQLCNVFRGSDERFWMSPGLFIYLPDISACSRGASDTDVGDWVTSERVVFKPEWLWGIQGRVIQVHAILIQRINFTARCVSSAMQRRCRNSLSCTY